MKALFKSSISNSKLPRSETQVPSEEKRFSSDLNPGRFVPMQSYSIVMNIDKSLVVCLVQWRSYCQ
jgi:hypothetical protein